MILRLRHAVPWLQKFGSWTTCTTPPPLARRYSVTSWATATLVPCATDAGSQPDTGGALSPSRPADTGVEKKKRRSTRGYKVSPAAEADKAVVSELPEENEGNGVEDDSAGASSSQETAPKRSTPSRRKAAASRSEIPGESSAAGASEPDPSMAPKRTRRKKQGEGLPVPAEETAPPGNKDDETEVRRGSSAGASSSSNITAAGTTKQKRASRGTSKKAAKGVTASSDEEQAKGEERVTIQRLPYEDFLVLPRQAEHVLIALGLRSPQETSSPAGVNEVGSPSAPATPLAAGRSGSIGTILELASYLGRSDPKELATPLLIAQYQGYLGPSPDYLYDLFCLDYEPPYLSSGAVKDAAVAAARSISHASSLLSAKGTPPETLARAAMDCLQAHVGMEVVAAQEVQAPRLAEAQLELFLLDWASARLAGLKGELGIPYLARRCAALQLTRPIVLERLYRYTVQGDSLQDLASAGGRTVRLSQPMDALLEGLKAGVRIDPERLLNDFRLSSLGAPLREHLQEVWRAVVQEAARSLEPGSAMYYTALVEKLHVNLGIRAALKQQEAEWQQEQGERDGSTLTYAQLRLLFHLWRLERFRAEEQARRRRQAAAATPGGTP